jgi:hypothetical protein
MLSVHYCHSRNVVLAYQAEKMVRIIWEFTKFILETIHVISEVPVTTAWRVVMLRMEERPPIWRVAANMLNKQSRTADKGWSSSLGVGRGANNS